MKFMGMNKYNKLFVYNTDDYDDVCDWLIVEDKEEFIIKAWQMLDKPDYDGCLGFEVDVSFVTGVMMAVQKKWDSMRNRQFKESTPFEAGYNLGKTIEIPVDKTEET